MKATLQIPVLAALLLLASISLASPASVIASDSGAKQSIGLAEAPIFAPKYNRRKIQRQNSPEKMNRRAKKLQRKNGLGFILIEKEASNG